MKHYSNIQTPLGNMVAVSQNGKIVSLDFSDQVVENNADQVLKRLADQLNEYFAGKREEFDLPLDPEGTEFQKLVWQTLGKIPYGTTISYKEESAMMGKPKAFRAVANANGKNPISIIIPCHRVIASGGKLGGYSGGLDKKRFLLALESNQKVNL